MTCTVGPCEGDFLSTSNNRVNAGKQPEVNHVCTSVFHLDERGSEDFGAEISAPVFSSSLSGSCGCVKFEFPIITLTLLLAKKIPEGSCIWIRAEMCLIASKESLWGSPHGHTFHISCHPVKLEISEIVPVRAGMQCVVGDRLSPHGIPELVQAECDHRITGADCRFREFF